MSLAARFAPTLLAVALAAPAHAEVSAAEAQALQGQIRAWVAGLLGPAVDLGDRTVRVSPDGDRYRFELPLAGPVGTTGTTVAGAPIVAMARPIEGGRWAIESLTLPSPLSVRAPAGAKMSNWSMKVADQDVRGVLDPSFASPSSFEATMRGYGAIAEGEDGTQTTHLDRYVSKGSWTPVGDGRVTMQGEARGENLRVVADLPGEPGAVSISAERMHTTATAERVAIDQLGEVIRAIGTLLPTAATAAGAAAAPETLTAEERASLRRIVLALGDLLAGAQQETTLERLRVDAAGQGATLARLSIGGGAASVEGKLDTSLRLALEGLETPLLPAGPMRDLLPRRVALSPRLSGIPVEKLTHLALRAIDGAESDELEADARALVDAGPVKLGLDDVVIDLGGSVMKANGVVSMVGPDDVAGTAQVTVTALDALIRRVNAVPELRSMRQTLIFLKGIGEQSGQTTVWKITYADGKAEVNGTDIRSLAAPPPARRK